MQFYAHHGFYKEEQVLGGKFVVDVYLETDFSEAAETDNLQKTVNYEKVYLSVKEIMEEPARLIEFVCQRILNKILNDFPQIKECKVCVSKLNPPLKGSVEKVSVTLAGKQ